MIAACWAQTQDGVIGAQGKIPWHYGGDLRRFKRLTIGCVIVMGRTTYASIGKPLPGRTNVVITNTIDEFDGCLVRRSVADTIDEFGRIRDIWFIGGARIYNAAMMYVDFIDQVLVPDVVPGPATCVGVIDPTVFNPGPVLAHPDEPALRQRTWVRRGKIDFADVERWFASRYEDASNELCRQQGSMSR